MAHPIARYLKRHDLTHEEFAKLLGVTRPTVTKVLLGQRRFSFDVAQRAVKVTRGEVTLHEAFGLRGKAA